MWVWASDGERLTYNAWHPSQPNNKDGDQDCAAYFPAADWGDIECTTPRQYVCQTDKRKSFIFCNSDGRFGSKVGEIRPKWEKSGAFSDQISVHLVRGAKCTEI